MSLDEGTGYIWSKSRFVLPVFKRRVRAFDEMNSYYFIGDSARGSFAEDHNILIRIYTSRRSLCFLVESNAIWSA